MSYDLRNNAQYLGSDGGKRWWLWTAYIQAVPPDSLEAIDCVEYRLHPSFLRPVRCVSEAEHGFALKVKGWGTFELVAELFFTNSRRAPELLRHNLVFNDHVAAQPDKSR